MRLRASVAVCLALSAVASPASAGWVLTTAFAAGTSTNQQSYVSPIDGGLPYTTKLGKVVFAEDGTTPVLLAAIAEQGIDDGKDTPKPLFGIGQASPTAPVVVYALTVEKNASGDVQSVRAKQAQELAAGFTADKSPRVVGAGFDHGGALYLLVHTFEMTGGPPSSFANVVRFAPKVGGPELWVASGEVVGSVKGPDGASLDGGDIAVMGDGTLVVAVGQLATGPEPVVPLYYRLCPGASEPTLAPLATSPAAGDLSADGLSTGTQVLAVSRDAKQSVVFPVTGGPFPAATPFLQDPSGLTVIETDLAGAAPFLDTDKDGLSDAEEGACANIRSVAGVGDVDYQDPDIDDDCLNDKDDVVVGAANPRESRQKATLPNENVDRNCRAGASTDGADDDAICVRKPGDGNPSCVPGCRVAVPGSGCPSGQECVVASGASTGTCVLVMPVPPVGGAGGQAGSGGSAGQAGVGGMGGVGGMAGSAGRGNVGIEGQAGTGGGTSTGTGAGTAKDDDSGSCALVAGPGRREGALAAALALLGLSIARFVRGRRRRG